jgi:hypothetical protein
MGKLPQAFRRCPTRFNRPTQLCYFAVRSSCAESQAYRAAKLWNLETATLRWPCARSCHQTASGTCLKIYPVLRQSNVSVLANCPAILVAASL